MLFSLVFDRCCIYTCLDPLWSLFRARTFAFVILCCPKICQHARFYDTCYRSLGFRIGHSPLSIWSGDTCISYQETRQAARSVRHVTTENFGNILLCIPNCELFVLSFLMRFISEPFLGINAWGMTAGDRLVGKSSILAVETMSYLFVWTFKFRYGRVDKRYVRWGPPILHVEGYGILLF